MSDPREPFDAERTNVMVRRFVLMLVLGSLFCAGIPFAENLHLGRDPAALVDLGLALLGLGACAIIGFSALMLAAKGAARQVRRLHVVVFSLILLTFLVQLLIPAVEPYGLVMLPLTVGGVGLGLWLFFADDRSWLGRWARPRIAELFDQLESVEVPPVSPIRVPQLPQPTTLAEAEDQLRLMREELERAQKVLREHSVPVAGG